MIKRTRYSREFKQAVLTEIRLGQSSIAQVSKRENIAGQTLRNWLEADSNGITGSEHQEIAALKRKIGELSEAMGVLAFENHILKKLQEFQAQKKKSADLSGPISPKKLVSSKDVN